MTNPHRIRLRRPWECRTSAGKTCWLRRFGRPMNLGPTEEVWLVIEGLPGPALLSFNGQALGTAPPGPTTLDITRLLAVRNELRMELDGAQPRATDSPPAVVALEIRPVGVRPPS